MRTAVVIVLSPLLLVGCTPSQTTGAQTVALGWTKRAEIPPTPAWAMPWQLTPASRLSRAQGEAIFSARVPSLGTVRGTKLALSNFSSPLVGSRVESRILKPCLDLVSSRARRLGAVRVEAVNLGRDRRRRDGMSESRIAFRILYEGDGDHQVRQAVLDCRANARGQIVEATVRA